MLLLLLMFLFVFLATVSWIQRQANSILEMVNLPNDQNLQTVVLIKIFLLHVIKNIFLHID